MAQIPSEKQTSIELPMHICWSIVIRKPIKKQSTDEAHFKIIYHNISPLPCQQGVLKTGENLQQPTLTYFQRTKNVGNVQKCSHCMNENCEAHFLKTLSKPTAVGGQIDTVW